MQRRTIEAIIIACTILEEYPEAIQGGDEVIEILALAKYDRRNEALRAGLSWARAKELEVDDPGRLDAGYGPTRSYSPA